MAIYQQKIQEFSGCSALRLGCLSWPSLNARILKKYALMAEKKSTYQCKNEQPKSKSILPLWPKYRLPPEDVAQSNGSSAHLKNSGLKVSLPTSNDLLRKILHRCTQTLMFWLVPDLVKLTGRNSLHTGTENIAIFLGPMKSLTLAKNLLMSFFLHQHYSWLHLMCILKYTINAATISHQRSLT